MIIKLTFKTPNVVDFALADLAITEEQRDCYRDIISKWVKYGEYLTVEIDTHFGDCKPIRVERPA